MALDSGAVLFAENTANRISALGGPYGDTLTPVVPDGRVRTVLGLSPEQAIYVTQVNDGKVGQVDTVNGKIVPIGDGLSRPTAVAGYNREVYVAEAGTGKVVKFDAERQRVEVATDLGTPNGIAIAPDGTIYVSDFTGDRIIKIAPNGDKTDWAQVTGPRQLALDPAFGKSGQPFQVVAGTSDGIVQFDQDAKVIATVPFPDQAVAGVGVVPGGPPPSVTPTTPVPTPTTVRPTTTVPTSSGLDEPRAGVVEQRRRHPPGAADRHRRDRRRRVRPVPLLEAAGQAHRGGGRLHRPP